MRKVCDSCNKEFITTPDDDTDQCDDCIRYWMTGERGDDNA